YASEKAIPHRLPLRRLPSVNLIGARACLGEPSGTSDESNLLATGHGVYPVFVTLFAGRSGMPIKPSRYQLAGAAIACILFMPALHAQTSTIDVGKMTCKEFDALPKDRVSAVTTWLDGHFTEEDEPNRTQ